MAIASETWGSTTNILPDMKGKFNQICMCASEFKRVLYAKRVLYVTNKVDSAKIKTYDLSLAFPCNLSWSCQETQ